ncbi:hypothetical protein K443DRAFT_676932 [Laccaria amethystina LaAM-08-1]|uniref:Uncharacterized protein n=1 Tax=Laccaria amethystina LaAM-08-1 TaxID=1095629 RepID=A0A0C9XP17_9AGAR|nr:hypothetical protein K443DRAFT_676932 [Laccaria amethystina LaAM-08-1]
MAYSSSYVVIPWTLSSKNLRSTLKDSDLSSLCCQYSRGNFPTSNTILLSTPF